MVWVGVVVVVVVLAVGDGGHHEAAFAPKLRVLQVAQLMYAAARVHRRVEPAQRGIDRSYSTSSEGERCAGQCGVVWGVRRGEGTARGRGQDMERRRVRGKRERDGTAQGRGRSP